jgi:hypothetical protein
VTEPVKELGGPVSAGKDGVGTPDSYVGVAIVGSPVKDGVGARVTEPVVGVGAPVCVCVWVVGIVGDDP